MAVMLAVSAAWACSSTSSSRLRDRDAAAAASGTSGTASTDSSAGFGGASSGGASSGGGADSGGSSAGSGASAGAGGAVDASGSAGAGTDAQAPRCNRSRPFGSPQPLGGVNSPSDETLGWMSADGLTFYFGSYRAAQSADIYLASRMTPSDPFGTPLALPAPVNTPANEGDPKLSSNGQSLFFSRDDDIHVATRASASADFASVAPVSNVNSPAGDWVGSLSQTGDRLYLQSNRSGSHHIYVAVLDNSGSFASPMEIAELNTAASAEVAPIVTPDTLTIYFGSTRAGGLGGSDIFVARRSTRTGTFGTLAAVPELNGPLNEAPSWVSADDCTIILTRRSVSLPTERDYFIAERPK